MIREQVNPVARLRPLKFRAAGHFRDVPLPAYVAESIDKHIASHGTTSDWYLFQGRKHKLVIRRTYQEDFGRSAEKAGLPPEFIGTNQIQRLGISRDLARNLKRATGRIFPKYSRIGRGVLHCPILWDHVAL